MSVKIADSTGYSKTLTYAQVTNGTGITVLDSTGATVTATIAPVAFLAYAKNGVALDTTLGPLRLGFFTSPGQYTQVSMWVKNVATITIIAAQ